MTIATTIRQGVGVAAGRANALICTTTLEEDEAFLTLI